MKSIRWIFLAAAVTFIAAATLTPGTATFPGGLRPDFWCMACGATGGADVAVNVTLFVPFGVALGLFVRGTLDRKLIWPTLAGFAFSVGIELAQRAGFPPSRVFNATDVLCNTLGTFVGAFIAGTSARWLMPSRTFALRLAAWGFASVALFLLMTAWALGPLPQSKSEKGLRTSRLPFAPGYGWFHGRVQHVSFGELTAQHEGDGPVIFVGHPDGSRQLAVEVSGRDERDGFVPFVYVHDENMSEPELMLGQEGTSARLSLKLRGSKLRLPEPSLFVHDAFAIQTGNSTRKIIANSSPALWELSVDDGQSKRSNSLRLSLAVGWTLFQTVVSLESPAAPLISAAWMFVPFIAIGYWCLLATITRNSNAAGERRDSDIAQEPRTGMAVVGFVGLVAVPVTLLAIPRMMGIADTSFAELLLAVSGYVTGVCFAWFALRNTRRFEALASGHAQANP